jgi:hypothetical protein
MQDLLEATRRATADIRQKDPLAHRRRRRENRPHIPKDVHKDLLGEDGNNLTEEDMKKANGLWKMLDDMYEADPAEYQKFIEKQMKAGREAGFKLPGEPDPQNVGGGAGTATVGHANAAPTGGSFTPNTGFVVKARKMYTGDKIFLNICSHPGVQIPLTAGGSNVDENTPGQFARQIPLLIGQPRSGVDKSKQPITAVDCVFNPWVITAVARDNMFKVNTVELALQWLHQDHQIKLQKNWKIIKSKYKCGGGKIGNVPIPFPIDDAKAQSSPGDSNNKTNTKNGTNKKQVNSKPSQKSVMSSPSELLKQARSAKDMGKNNADSSNISINTSNMDTKKGNKKKPLIQDLTIKDDETKGEEINTNTASTTTTTKTTRKTGKKKKKKVIKGGFLQNNKEALYPNGSNEGAPKGLLSKCKVVDTTKMNEDELKKTMEAYAAPGGNRVPRKKTVQQTTTKSKKKKKKAKEPKPVNPVLDAEFDEMMNMVDPDLAKTNVQSGVGGTGNVEFDALTNLLSGNTSMGDLTDMAKMTDLRKNFTDERKKIEKINKESAVSKATPIASEKTQKKKKITKNKTSNIVKENKSEKEESYKDLVGQTDVWELE